MSCPALQSPRLSLQPQAPDCCDPHAPRISHSLLLFWLSLWRRWLLGLGGLVCCAKHDIVWSRPIGLQVICKSAQKKD